MKPAPSKLRLVRMRETERRVGLCEDQIGNLEKAGKFPRRVRISERAIGYVEHELDAWLEARVAARDQQAATG